MFSSGRSSALLLLQRCWGPVEQRTSQATVTAAAGQLRMVLTPSTSATASGCTAATQWLQPGAAHSYHRGRDDEDNGPLHDNFQELMSQAVASKQPRRWAGRNVREGVRSADAERILGDPTAMLMASRGVPLGITLKMTEPEGDYGDESSTSSSMRSSNDMAAQIADLAESVSNRTQAANELDRIMRAAGHDSWDVTRQGPAEIARRIVESNEGSGSSDGGGGGDGSSNRDEGDDMLEDALQLAAGERAVEQLTADLRHMDEIFEILARVPWLDDSDVDDRELRGMVSVSLLGTLEEVGWNLRRGVERIWAGERDSDAVAEGADGRERAALISILYHTRRFEDEQGPPGGAAVGRNGSS